MREIEAAVAEALSSATGQVVEKEDVILDVIMAPPAKKSEGSVLLKGERGERRTFEDASVIFRSIDQTLQAASLQCYAPIADVDDVKRRKAEARVAEVIVNSVQKLASAETPARAHEQEPSHGD